MEPLPKDCPAQLGELINACRSYDAFQRPTAGGIISQQSCMGVTFNDLAKQKVFLNFLLILLKCTTYSDVATL